MIRASAFVLLLAGVATAAPVPKELRARPSHVGKWQSVDLDPSDPKKIRFYGQYWYLAEDGNFTYQNKDAMGPPPKLAELMVFDPVSGRVVHSKGVAGEKPRLGRYAIEGDRLTMNLTNNGGTPCPKGLAAEPGSAIWTLLRMEEGK